MQADIYIAATLDGFIATKDGGSDWVKDDAMFKKTARAYGCVAVGHTTFTQYQGDLYPLKNVQHIVLSREPQPSTYPNVHFAKNVADALVLAKKLGFGKLLVIGGAKTNRSFLEANAVTHVMVDVHQLTLGTGMPMFGGFNGKLDFTLVSYKWHKPGFMHAAYTINAITKGNAHGHPTFADEPR